MQWLYDTANRKDMVNCSSNLKHYYYFSVTIVLLIIHLSIVFFCPVSHAAIKYAVSCLPHALHHKEVVRVYQMLFKTIFNEIFLKQKLGHESDLWVRLKYHLCSESIVIRGWLSPLHYQVKLYWTVVEFDSISTVCYVIQTAAFLVVTFIYQFIRKHDWRLVGD